MIAAMKKLKHIFLSVMLTNLLIIGSIAVGSPAAYAVDDISKSEISEISSESISNSDPTTESEPYEISSSEAEPLTEETSNSNRVQPETYEDSDILNTASDICKQGGTYAMVVPAMQSILQEFSDEHPALDLAAEAGSAVVAAENGIVVQIQTENTPITDRSSAYGNMILIQHEDGNQTLYAHLEEIGVSAGDAVSRGQQIGTVGMTGEADQPMLHLEVVTPWIHVDPYPYISSTVLYAQASLSAIKAQLEGGTNYISDFGSITRESLIAELEAHQNDNYYLNTPYVSGDHQSPNGDTSYNGAKGMNCAGFISYVLRKSGLDANAAMKAICKTRHSDWNSGRPYSMLAAASNYFTWAENSGLKCYAYESMDALLAGGKAVKGDLILCYVNQPWLLSGAEDNHLTIFWGDSPSENLVWHQNGFSTKDVNGNQYNQIIALNYYISSAKYVLIKLDDTTCYSSYPVGKITSESGTALRKGPGSSFRQILTIPYNAHVRVLNKSNPVWYKVQYGDQTGYMASKDIRFQIGSISITAKKLGDTSQKNSVLATAPPTPSSEQIASKEETISVASESSLYAWAVADNGLNLRRGPGTGYGVIVTIPCGSAITVLDRSNASWYKVQYGSYTGYVSSKYVRFQRTASIKAPVLSPEDSDFPVTSPEPENTIEEWHTTLVNPWNTIPEDYAVTLKTVSGNYKVDARCYDYLIAMLEDCEAAGCEPLLCSAYRTHATQNALYRNKVQRLMNQGMSRTKAEAEAAKSVAVPGTSEHQLGLAVDIVDLRNQTMTAAQANTKTQKWLMENSWKYGFILRYPENKTDITGIIYEPWHYRYVGYRLAKTLRDCGLTLEEYMEAVENSASLTANTITLDKEVTPLCINVQNGLNLRSGPGFDYGILCTLPTDSVIQVLEYSDSEWYKVQYQGQIGYIYSSYLYS